MKYSITLLVRLTLCFLLISTAQAGGLTKGPKRSRVSSSGLMPFPRVGRSGSWEMEPNGLADYHDDVKRSKFLQFPRVGRANYNPYSSNEEDYDLSMDKRAGSVPGGGNKNSGLWFGPRLGRLHKRSDGRVVFDGESGNGNVAAYAYLIELFPKQLHYATPRFANEPSSTVEEQIEDEQQHGGRSPPLDMST